ncbi:response regulator [Paraburkholderia sp. PGU19]|uniref:response regulator n=1 Tax=Paraburkholderia sp. PGU19 TaxID=2735434 RepID=UPI001FB14992|nr:response regulator [Paraburkholderia sp. PGU19]
MATILLVDDDTKILHSLQILLEVEGYRVLTAPDGEVGAAITAMQRPDLIVTDWMMPHVAGVEFCHRLKDDPATSRIPIAMLSSALHPAPTAPPWNVFLRKPVPVKRLLEVIASLLDERVLSVRSTDIAPPATDAGLMQRTDPMN